MTSDYSGFKQPHEEVGELLGLYSGTVVARDDPEKLGRVRVVIPGLIEPDSNWALPKGGGSKHWGQDNVPPLGSEVFVQFVNGNPDVPVYEPAWRAKVKNETTGERESWSFSEHQAGGPDVHVFGIGNFRLVIDDREGQRYAALRVIKEVKGAEDVIVEIKFDIEGNALRIFGTTAVKIESLGVIDVDTGSDVQIKGRKVMPSSKPIN
jgi:hypothetical protein